MVENAYINDVRGGRLVIGTISHDPASLATVTKRSDAVTVSGVKAEDQLVSIHGRDLPAGLHLLSAKVSDDDEITLDLYNSTGSGIDAGALTFDVQILLVE